MNRRTLFGTPVRVLVVSALLVLPVLGTSRPAAAELRVVTTTPDLADLVRRVGGDRVVVDALVRGPQDPHFVEPRPSFVQKLHRADLFVEVGLDLEVGWSPTLLQAARNPDVRPGGPGHVYAASVISPRDVPTTRVDRSMGDVHPYGNPHYLLDPVNGGRVAALLRDRLSELDPEGAAAYTARYEAFASELARRVAGWERLLAPHAGTRVVEDHKMWGYFAARFGLEVVMALEPRPGIAPTTAHLREVIERVRAEGIPLVLQSAYFDPGSARKVAEATGARVVVLAHQVGAREGADDYLSMIDYNVRAVAEAL